MQELVTVRIVLVAKACAESMVSLPGIDLSKSRRQQWHVGCSASTHRGSTPLAAPCLRASITIVALRVECPPISRQELVLALLAVSGEYFPSVASLIGTHLSLVQLSLATLYVKYMRGTTGHEPGLTRGNGLTVAKDVEQTHVGRSVAP